MPRDIPDKVSPLPETILQAKREYAKHRRAHEETSGALRAVLKRWKSEGVDTKALIASYQDAKQDPAEVEREIGNRIRYNRLSGMQINLDFAFAEEHLTQRQRDAEAEFVSHQDGYQAAKMGAPVEDNPHELGRAEHVAWRKGWTEATEKLPAKANTSRTRPARRGRTSGARKRGNGGGLGLGV